jgi:5'-nucleotidase
VSIFLSRRTAATVACTALVLSPAAAAPALAVESDADGTTTISVLSFNDFHGALSPTFTGTQFADTVEDYRRDFEARHGEGSTLLTSAGDLVGASASVSNVQQDNPTIDVMNALGLDVLAAGNHEFDRGLDDLTGRIQARADFPVVAANFVEPGTTDSVLPSHAVFDVNGVRVAVIGAAPEDLYASTTASGLQGKDLLDLVESVNRVAAEIEAADAADVIVASYHDGAAGSGELEAELADREIFRRMVEQTSASVDVVFNGHTHQLYNFVTDVDGVKRPVMQAGASGSDLAAVELTVEQSTGDVVDVQTRMLERSTQDPAAAAAESSVTAEVYAIEQDAVAVFEDMQSTVIADLDGSITTDYATVLAGGGTWRAGGSRTAETTLGNWVADGLKHAVAQANPNVDLGVTNPGGLRSEILLDRFNASGSFPAKPADLVGKLTLGEILDVAPFGNTLVYFDIPGSSIKLALEENWRADAKRFNLGWSENLTWTYDESRPQGEKVTGVWIDGEPVAADQMYTVATLSFLADDAWVAAGDPTKAPDGYTAFATGRENFVNIGLVDSAALTDYARAQDEEDGSVGPDYAKKGVSLTGTQDTVAAGAPITATLGDIAIDSDGVPEVTEVAVAFRPTGGQAIELGTVPVPAGADSVSLDGILAPAAQGQGVLEMTLRSADGTQSVVRHLLTVTGAETCAAGDFSDNQPGMAYYSAIRWMQCAGLANGYRDGSFGKTRDTSRGETATILYRYLTDRDIEVTAQAFPDVPAGHSHFRGIGWASAQQLVRGYVDGTFRPGRDITRGEFAIILFRASGEQGAFVPPTTGDFSDVPATDSAYAAVQWMASEGLATGYADGTFGARQDITRGEAAALLHRYENMVRTAR